MQRTSIALAIGLVLVSGTAFAKPSEASKPLIPGNSNRYAHVGAVAKFKSKPTGPVVPKPVPHK
jgi:hypothetical protein